MTSIEEIRELLAGTAEITRQNSEAILEMQASQAEANKRDDKRWAEADKRADKRWAEADKRWAEADKRSAEADKRWAERQKRWDEEHERSREAIRELRASQAEAAKSWAERQKRWDEGLADLKHLREDMREHREEMREELIASRQDSDRIWTAIYKELRELRHDVGRLGNKLGVLTESMFFPSLDRILRQDFGMQVVEPRAYRDTSDGKELEIDVFAHAHDAIDRVFDVGQESLRHPRRDRDAR